MIACQADEVAPGSHSFPTEFTLGFCETPHSLAVTNQRSTATGAATSAELQRHAVHAVDWL